MDLDRENLDFFVEVRNIFHFSLIFKFTQEKDLQSFRRAFEIFDADNSGRINVEEMDKLIIELTSHDPTEEEVKQVNEFWKGNIFLLTKKIKIIKEFDADESGKVEFKEFVRVMAKKAENAKIIEKEEEFRKAFQVQ